VTEKISTNSTRYYNQYKNLQIPDVDKTKNLLYRCISLKDITTSSEQTVTIKSSRCLPEYLLDPDLAQAYKCNSLDTLSKTWTTTHLLLTEKAQLNTMRQTRRC